MTIIVTRNQIIAAVVRADGCPAMTERAAEQIAKSVCRLLDIPDTPEEPPAGSVVIDRYGDAWQHDERGYWVNAEGGIEWAKLLAVRGPLRLVHTPDAAKEA